MGEEREEGMSERAMREEIERLNATVERLTQDRDRLETLARKAFEQRVVPTMKIAAGDDVTAVVLADTERLRARAAAAEEREGRLREALALLWAEATDPGRGPVHLSQPCRSAVLRALAALDGGEGA
jgi:hypothetical protein